MALVDLGFSGNPYTWDNMRECMAAIRERFDRALVNPPWINEFPQTKVLHLPRIFSDHSPIVISIDNSYMHGLFPFRCKEVWLNILILRIFF